MKNTIITAFLVLFAMQAWSQSALIVTASGDSTLIEYSKIRSMSAASRIATPQILYDLTYLRLTPKHSFGYIMQQAGCHMIEFTDARTGKATAVPITSIDQVKPKRGASNGYLFSEIENARADVVYEFSETFDSIKTLILNCTDNMAGDWLGAYTDMSVEGTGVVVNKIKLVNDEDAPGNEKYYGTDPTGTKGWHTFPGPTYVQPDTGSTITIYAPAHGLGDSITANGVVPVKGDFTIANAQAFDSIHIAYAIAAPDVDSLTLKFSGTLTFGAWHGYEVADQYYLTDTYVMGTTPGTLTVPTVYATDSLTLLLSEVGPVSLAAFQRVSVPSPVITAFGGDPQVPTDAVMQAAILGIYVPSGIAQPGTMFTLNYIGASKNPTYQENTPATNPLTPSYAWMWDGTNATRIENLVVSIDLQDTAYGIFGNLPLTPIDSLTSTFPPPDSAVAMWVDTNYTQGLRLASGSIVYYIGSGSAQAPAASWMIIDDLSNISGDADWMKIIKKLGSAGYWELSATQDTITPNYLPYVTRILADTVHVAGGSGDEGVMTWDSDEETVDIIQNGAILQVGQEVQVHVRNNTGVQIDNGTVVMATGTIGASGRITVAPYDGTTNIKYVLGVATEDIANGDDGKVTSFGKVRGISTDGSSVGETWIDGEVLYATTAGNLTNIEPTSGIKNSIAFVINAHVNNGTLMVRFTPQNELAKLNDLSDVDTSGINTNDILQWNGIAWTVTSLSGGGIFSAANEGASTAINTIDIVGEVRWNATGSSDVFKVYSTRAGVGSMQGINAGTGTGVYGEGSSGTGVFGYSFNSAGVEGYSFSGYGLKSGKNGLQLVGQSADPTGTGGVVFYDSDDNGFKGHDGTSYFFIPESSDHQFTNGSVIFADANGRLSQDNGDLYWDSSQDELRINSASDAGNYGLQVWNKDIWLDETLVFNTSGEIDGSAVSSGSINGFPVKIYNASSDNGAIEVKGYQAGLYAMSVNDSDADAVIITAMDAGSNNAPIDQIMNAIDLTTRRRWTSSNENNNYVTSTGGIAINWKFQFESDSTDAMRKAGRMYFQNTSETYKEDTKFVIEGLDSLTLLPFFEAEEGRITLPYYGTNIINGIPSSYSAWNSDGQFIEVTASEILSDGGAPTGSGAANRVAYWSDPNTLSSNSNFLWDGDLSVGTTNSSYTVDVGQGGIRLAPESSSVVGATGAMQYYGFLKVHDGTSWYFVPKSSSAAFSNNRVPYSNGSSLVSSGNFTFSGSLLTLTSSDIKLATANSYIQSYEGTNQAIRFTSSGIEMIHYGFGNDRNVIFRNREGTRNTEIGYFPTHDRSLFGNRSGLRTNYISGYSTNMQIRGYHGPNAGVDGGNVSILGGTGYESKDDSGDVRIYGGPISSDEGTPATYEGTPGDVLIYTYPDTTNGFGTPRLVFGVKGGG